MNKLPTIIKPRLLCQKAPAGSVLEGDYPLEKILNVSQELRKQALTPLHYYLRFYVDQESYSEIEGEITGDFELVCQRCLKPMLYRVKAEVKVSPVSSDAEAKRLPARYEPLLMEEDTVNLAEWIAEELHLALPLVPRHETLCISHDSYIKEPGDENNHY